MKQAFAFLFPGQGSQFLGMLQQLALQFPCVKQTFTEASDILHYDLWQVVEQGPVDHLNQTAVTQPAMLTADIAVYRCWQAQTAMAPTVMAGHSLGEYAALVVAGALTFKEAVALVAKRGLYMQEAVPIGAGAMAAIVGLEDSLVVALCVDAAQGQVVAPANFNSVGQVVIAGDKDAVLRAVALAKLQGAKLATLIPVSVPSHSPLMRTAAEKLAQDLKRVVIKKPHISVIQNADVKQHQEPEKIRELLVQQLVLPVRWVETIKKMHADGITIFVECGPGKVLAGLIKRIERSALVLQTDHPDFLEAAVKAVM